MNLLFTAVAAIVVFLFGLQEFSQEVRRVGGRALSDWLGRWTRSRWHGVVLGAIATALVQSSSAVTALAVALVDAGTISFKASLGILLGANIGTTLTAWLVSLKLTSIGPFFIVLGTILGALPTRWKTLGKTAFFFGFIFLSLELVGDALRPLQDLPNFQKILASASTPILGVVAGLVLTAIVQASSITIGLAILLVQQGVLPPTAAIAIVMGANIGTTSTGLLASLKMTRNAQRSAVANLIFNVVGVLLFLPFIATFANAVVDLAGGPTLAIAWAQLIFNLVMTLVMMVLLKVFDAWIAD